MTPRSIGFLCRGWAPDPGGVESHTQDLAQALTDRGVRVEVLCTGRDSEAPAYAVGDWKQGGARVRRMNLAGVRPGSLECLDSDPRADTRVGEWLDFARPDLVHVHHLSGFGFGALTEIAKHGLPSIVTLHDYWTLCPRGQMFSTSGEICSRVDGPTCSACIAGTWPGMEPSPADVHDRLARARRALALAHRLVAPSHGARRVLLEAGLEGLDIDCVPNSLNSAPWVREVARLRAGRSAGKRLGVIGSVQPSKGVLELAQAVVQAQVPGLVLDVHGPLSDYHGNTDYVDALRYLARSHSRIRLHGPFMAHDLPRILTTLDGLAVPSRWEEVFGLSAREARAVGLPVLATRRGGLTEWEDDAGITFVAGTCAEDWIGPLAQFTFGVTMPELSPPTHQPGVDLVSVYAGMLPGAEVQTAS